jgi:hypothetical protein
LRFADTHDALVITENPRVIGSIRRQCLDHIVTLGEAHLRRVFKAYVAYYNHVRPHVSLWPKTRHCFALPNGSAR